MEKGQKNQSPRRRKSHYRSPSFNTYNLSSTKSKLPKQPFYPNHGATAWSTSPNLDLDQRNFPNPGQIAAAFSEFANKTMQRYLESNLKIEKFSLWMKSTEGDRDPLLANELISKALRMGVHDLNFEIHPPIDTFVLPDEVLGAETLIGLSLIGVQN
ncbi:F-box/LRR-repeat protein at4g14096 [Phtheirospermum japonicum]|uniref:F-box/LRR-repeat protein at4g14096 n=1 Tax=Phtheirospermum japonicum TaxID=374723 RepID=A0A830C7T8_9LAMI|nr:F-box/LRR-repeat protein at4g14096 [Phtheirospermum japonicum]